MISCVNAPLSVKPFSSSQFSQNLLVTPDLFYMESMGCQVGLIFLVGPVQCVEPRENSLLDGSLLPPPSGFATKLKMALDMALVGCLGCEIHSIPTPI